jgi:phage baseplate assembly protein V
MADDFARLERRIKALEGNLGAVLRFGAVTETDESAGSARVRIFDADNLVTMPLRVLQRRTLKDQHQELPDIGEHVACLFAGQGYEQGVVLGAVYSAKDPSPGKPPHVWYRRFEDGTELEYDREEHRLRISVNGDIIIKAGGLITINAAHVSIQE